MWLGTRFIATPEARTVTGYKDALLRAHEDDTVISRGFTGKTLRAMRNEWTQYIEEHPEELSKFPEQMGKAVAANALHLGGDENTPVDPDKECYPSGQGVGAIDELVPAGDLVRQIVDEAEHALRAPRDRRALNPRRLQLSRAQAQVPELQPGFGAFLGEVVLVHHPDELLEADPRLPSELLVRLRRVADQQVDLGRAVEARVLLDVRRPVVDAGVLERRRRAARGWCASRRSR